MWRCADAWVSVRGCRDHLEPRLALVGSESLGHPAGQKDRRQESHELQDGPVIADNLDGRRCIFLAALYRAEREIAENLRVLARGKPPWPAIDADKAISWVETWTKLALADSQRQALPHRHGNGVARDRRIG